ncbi:MAG: isochorismatase family protein [Acidobacteria bacterium]|nr:isochorismatase family protein [Acidobacteriota bacterium]
MNLEIPIRQSALLVIDVQDSFKVGPRWQRRNNPEFEHNIELLIAGYRAAGLPVYFFLDSDDSEHFRPDSPYFKLMDFVQPRESEPVLVKTSRNCFTSTNLDQLLRLQDTRRVIVTGIKTEQCCETTARIASDLGYGVDFVTEATLTFPIPHTELSEELSAAEVVRRTEYALRQRFARIATVDALLAELEGQELR